MSKVLIIGGGLAGAVTAKELASQNVSVVIAEASGSFGGKVRGYGCKSTDKCANCGVCLTRGLWDSVENNPLIEILPNTRLVDLMGGKGCFTATLNTGGAVSPMDGISDVVVATGFEQMKREHVNAFVELDGAGPDDRSVITGSDIERIFLNRSKTRLFDRAPERIAFIQCYGSRDAKERAMYCSRVCCGYSTRAAKVIKNYYPDCEITFFYMEMQQVRGGNYFDELKELGIRFIKCRPVKIQAGDPASVWFDNPDTGRRERLDFDGIVLSDGIRPSDGAARTAELCGLGQTEDGFLRYVTDSGDAERTGVYIAGCAGGPARIEEVYGESVAVAQRILFQKEAPIEKTENGSGE
ncbi:MAG: NAD(P)-binding protein [Clostridiales bacterium]|nr:NAD(P)-binding protein [Clostridiales bacterium]